MLLGQSWMEEKVGGQPGTQATEPGTPLPPGFCSDSLWGPLYSNLLCRNGIHVFFLLVSPASWQHSRLLHCLAEIALNAKLCNSSSLSQACLELIQIRTPPSPSSSYQRFKSAYLHSSLLSVFEKVMPAALASHICLH